jgi:membrane dipeptidase
VVIDISSGNEPLIQYHQVKAVCNYDTVVHRRSTMQQQLRQLAVIGIAVLVSACTLSGGANTPAIEQDSALAIHQRALVLDAHADIEIPGKEDRYAGADGRSKVAADKMRAGGVDAVVMSVAVNPGPRTPAGYAAARAQADEELAAVVAMTEDPANNLVLVRSAQQLLSAHAAGKGALILGFQNALILGNDVSTIDDFYGAGVRVFALTHMGHNNFADSSRPLYIAAQRSHEAVEEHGGLSELGRAAIVKINALGAIVDISQLSKAAALEVLDLSSAPVIASHSNVRALTDVSRNLSDEEIDRIGENGGVIHIAPFRGYLFDSTNADLDGQIRAARREAGIEEDSYYPFELYWEIEDPQVQQAFLATVSGLLGPGSVSAMLDHIDYIVERIGIDHVGIGTDFNHGSGIEGFNDASEALNVTKGLLARGYSADDIEKIWGGNFLRVFTSASEGH